MPSALPLEIAEIIISQVKESGTWDEFNENMIYYVTLQQWASFGIIPAEMLPAKPVPENFPIESD